MENSCPPAASAASDSATTTTSSSSSHNSNNATVRQPPDHVLKQLNKSSLKISKQPHHQHLAPHPKHLSQPSIHPVNPLQQQQQQQQPQAPEQAQAPPPPQQQPPVYNINKNDFRDVVQKLTGSPAHERFSTPPPIHPPKPPSSRLQRIRPPPLAHVSNRPAPSAQLPLFNPDASLNANITRSSTGIYESGVGSAAGIFNGRPRSPFSPLPPFPTVSTAAESPISAYMRYLQSSISSIDPGRGPGLSPRWSPNLPLPFHQGLMPSPPGNLAPPLPLPSQQFMRPPSPMPFGQLPLSPRSPYPLLSPGLLFSPSAQLGFPPLSPRLPITSPKWRGDM